MKNDIEGLKQNLMKERQFRAEEEKRNEQMEHVIQDRERELNRMNNEIDSMKTMNQRITDDKMNGQMENEKLKNHIMVLTQQNQKLIAEIENVIDQDEKMKEQLARKDRIVAVLRNNKMTIEQSLNNLDDFLNRSNSNMQRSTNFSQQQRYTYNRMSPSVSN